MYVILNEQPQNGPRTSAKHAKSRADPGFPRIRAALQCR